MTTRVMASAFRCGLYFVRRGHAVRAWQQARQRFWPKPGDSKVNPKDGLRYLWIPPGTLLPDARRETRNAIRTNIRTARSRSPEDSGWARPKSRKPRTNKSRRQPSVFQGPDLPVEMVSWDEADTYCTRDRRPAAIGSGMGVRGQSRDNRAPLWQSRRDRLVLEEQQIFHAPGRPEETQRVRVIRHARQRGGVDLHLVYGPAYRRKILTPPDPARRNTNR